MILRWDALILFIGIWTSSIAKQWNSDEEAIKYPYINRYKFQQQLPRAFSSSPSPWIDGPHEMRYQFNIGHQSWLSAREHCLTQNADLVTIKNPNELDWILSHYQPRFKHLRERQIQIGLLVDGNDAYREWKWVDGEPLNRTLLPWINGEPYDHADGRERCAVLGVNMRRLDDIDCDLPASETRLFRFVCKRTKDEHLKHEHASNPIIKKLEELLSFFGINPNTNNLKLNFTKPETEDYWEAVHKEHSKPTPGLVALPELSTQVETTTEKVEPTTEAPVTTVKPVESTAAPILGFIETTVEPTVEPTTEEVEQTTSEEDTEETEEPEDSHENEVRVIVPGGVTIITHLSDQENAIKKSENEAQRVDVDVGPSTNPPPSETPPPVVSVPSEAPQPEKPVPSEAPRPEKPVPSEAPQPEKHVPSETPQPVKPAPSETSQPEKPVPNEAPTPEKPAPSETPQPQNPVPAETPQPVPSETPRDTPKPVTEIPTTPAESSQPPETETSPEVQKTEASQPPETETSPEVQKTEATITIVLTPKELLSTVPTTEEPSSTPAPAVIAEHEPKLEVKITSKEELQKETNAEPMPGMVPIIETAPIEKVEIKTALSMLPDELQIKENLEKMNENNDKDLLEPVPSSPLAKADPLESLAQRIELTAARENPSNPVNPSELESKMENLERIVAAVQKMIAPLEQTEPTTAPPTEASVSSTDATSTMQPDAEPELKKPLRDQPEIAYDRLNPLGRGERHRPSVFGKNDPYAESGDPEAQQFMGKFMNLYSGVMGHMMKMFDYDSEYNPFS